MLITTFELGSLGFGPEAIRRFERHDVLTRRHRGVYSIGDAAFTFDLQSRAALLATNGALSHHTATYHWLMRPTRPGPIHVSIPGRGGRARRAGLIIHRPRSLLSDLQDLNGLTVTTPTRTLLDTAPLLPRYARFRALEEAERHRLDIERDRLEDSRALRQALDLFDHLGPCTRSDAEAMFLFICLDYGIPLPHVNRRFHGEEFDFRWPQAGYVVEVDGFRFHDGQVDPVVARERFENDRRKGLVADQLDQRFTRFSVRQLKRQREQVARLVIRRLGASARP